MANILVVIIVALQLAQDTDLCAMMGPQVWCAPADVKVCFM